MDYNRITFMVKAYEIDGSCDEEVRDELFDGECGATICQLRYQSQLVIEVTINNLRIVFMTVN